MKLASGRVLGAAQVTAVLVLVLITGACGRADNEAQPTPIAALEDFNFEEYLTDVPPSGSPSPSPTLVPVGGPGSGSSGPRSGSSGTSAAAAKPSGPTTCPSGRVIGEMSDVDVSHTNETNRDGVPRWVVRASGTVTNQASRSVRDIRINVTLRAPNAEGEDEDTVLGKWIGTTATSSWSVTFDRYTSRERPGKNDVTFAITGWSWGDASFSQCPTPGFSG